MNRHEQRDIEWSKKDHNRIYKDAAVCWKETGSVEAVATLLIERGFGIARAQGYLIEYRGLPIDEAKEMVLHAERKSFESPEEEDNV